MKKILFCLIAMMVALVLEASAYAMPIINGGFDTGFFTGWTLFTTTNGTLGHSPDPLVESFDTDNDSVLSNAARFQVGQTPPFSVGSQEGGGIFQNILTGAGDFKVGVDIASFKSKGQNNIDGGLFSLIWDTTVIDTFDFGDIAAGTAEYATLSADISTTAGSHKLSILMTRRFLTVAAPYQYVDDFYINPIPEPTTIALLGIGLVGLAGAEIRRRRKKKTVDNS